MIVKPFSGSGFEDHNGPSGEMIPGRNPDGETEMSDPVTRRSVLRLGVTGLIASQVTRSSMARVDPQPPTLPSRPFLTPGKDFQDVSRGNPVPHTLKGDALLKARLTPETWRMEIAAEDKATIESPLTLDLQALHKLGEKHGVCFLKAMQCNNIALPLGQGLWEGVPLREVLKRCGKLENARRVFYWGFHNDDSKQMFRSSLALNQVLDTPPGELPPFVAYRLNGEPIPLERGGPVRMVVPWAHGFKSIKWLQNIVCTNRYEANDTYALQNNDPESYLKTAAYFDRTKTESFPQGKPIHVHGTAMVGWPGLDRVEYWLRPDTGAGGKLDDKDPAWTKAEWKTATIDPFPSNWGGLPTGVQPKDVWGFGADGKPKKWPMRYSVALWSLVLKDLKPGAYELRVRTVDENGIAQPEPRPNPRSGRNRIVCKLITVTA
jgi:DMSO/TMAO reductase YedYZ molybdopterin-dependent catalytic subunit